MPRVDNPNAVANTIQGQVAAVKAATRDIKGSSIPALTALITNLVVPQVGHNSVSGFSVATGATELVRYTFTVPTGCTRAQVMVVGAITAKNTSSSSGVQVHIYADVNGGSSTLNTAQLLQPLAQGGCTAAASAVLTGLTAGSTFFVRSVAFSDVIAFSSTASNYASIDATALFLP